MGIIRQESARQPTFAVRKGGVVLALVLEVDELTRMIIEGRSMEMTKMLSMRRRRMGALLVAQSQICGMQSLDDSDNGDSCSQFERTTLSSCTNIFMFFGGCGVGLASRIFCFQVLRNSKSMKSLVDVHWVVST